MSAPPDPTPFLQYGAMGVLVLVLLGVGALLRWGGTRLFDILQTGLNQLLEKQDDANQKLVESISSARVEIEKTRAQLHEHLSESERRIIATCEGRKPTPPPFRSYGGE